MTNTEIFAWHQEPAPNGTLFYESDFEISTTVIQVFSKIKESEGYITPKGWQHLFEFHGVQNIFNYDCLAGWFDTENKTEWLNSFFLSALTSGFDPTANDFGDYDLETGEFITLQGSIAPINWKMIRSMNKDL